MNSYELTQAGYKQCVDNMAPEYVKETRYFYQKKIYRITDGILLYFINVYEYDWRHFNHRNKDFAYEAKLHLYVDDKADCLHVHFNCDEFEVRELEEYVSDLYLQIGCVPDKLND